MDKDKKVLVSVIIPTYKRPDMLCKAVDSVLNQTYSNIELIVIDDNDPSWPERQATEMVMCRYKDNPKVLYLQHEANKNGSAARNTGIKASHGKYIAFLDDDDEFFPEKIEKQVICLESKDETWGVCYCNYWKVKGERVLSNKVRKIEGNVLADALARNLFIASGSTILVRSNVVKELGGYDESFKRNQDLEFLVRILLKYKLAYANVNGVKINIHSDKSRKMVDALELRDKYIETFKKYIIQLPIEEQSRIHKLINLQTFRQYLTMRELKRASAMIRGNLKIAEVVAYMCHLLYRRLHKVACGYKVTPSK